MSHDRQLRMWFRFILNDSLSPSSIALKKEYEIDIIWNKVYLILLSQNPDIFNNYFIWIFILSVLRQTYLHYWVVFGVTVSKQVVFKVISKSKFVWSGLFNLFSIHTLPCKSYLYHQVCLSLSKQGFQQYHLPCNKMLYNPFSIFNPLTRNHIDSCGSFYHKLYTCIFPLLVSSKTRHKTLPHPVAVLYKDSRNENEAYSSDHGSGSEQS